MIMNSNFLNLREVHMIYIYVKPKSDIRSMLVKDYRGEFVFIHGSISKYNNNYVIVKDNKTELFSIRNDKGGKKMEFEEIKKALYAYYVVPDLKHNIVYSCKPAEFKSLYNSTNAYVYHILI